MDDTKPTRQMLYRINLAMKEVVKAKFLKLLDVGIIGPIADGN